MDEFERVLVIDIDEIYSRRFLFHVSPERVELVSQKRVLTSLSTQEMIEATKLEYKGRYDKVHIVTDRNKAFQNVIKDFSSWGFMVGVLIESEVTFSEYVTFGRVMNSQSMKIGLGRGIDKIMAADGLDYFKKWLDIVEKESSLGSALNFLGNYTHYPTMSFNSSHSINAVNGILRFIFSQISLLNSMYFTRDEGVYKQQGINRVILSGDIFSRFKSKGMLMLSIIDGLQLEGVWEIFIDQHVVLPALGFNDRGLSYSFSDLKIKKLGTLLVLNHRERWGEQLGKVVLDVGLTENQTLLLKSGELVRIPLSSEANGTVELDVHQDVTVKNYSGQVDLSGGEIGLVIDVRGRPLPSLEDKESLINKFPHWKEAMK